MAQTQVCQVTLHSSLSRGRQIQKHTIEFILTSLGGHFGIRLAVEVESPVDYFKHLSDVFRDVKTTGLW